jgi:hypothetical protein
MQAAVRIRTASTALFDDEQLPVTTNPAYDHHRASIGDYAQRTARLEKRVDDAKTCAYKTNMCVNEMKNEMKSRVGVAEKRADVAEKRADNAELVAQQTIARILALEQTLELALSRKEGGELGSGRL